MKILVPSNIVPGDYAQNLRFLEQKRVVQGVELLFYAFDRETKEHLAHNWKEILAYAGHTPDSLGDPQTAPLPKHYAEILEEKKRTHSLSMADQEKRFYDFLQNDPCFKKAYHLKGSNTHAVVQRIVAFMEQEHILDEPPPEPQIRFFFTARLPETLHPDQGGLVMLLEPLVQHFVVLPGSGETQAAQAATLADWLDRFGPDRFVLENTASEGVEPFLSLLPWDIGLCMDTGSLLLEGKNPASYFARYGKRIKEIHLHSINRDAPAWDKRPPDHRPVRRDQKWFRDLAQELPDFDGFVTLELSSWNDVAETLQALVGLHA